MYDYNDVHVHDVMLLYFILRRNIYLIFDIDIDNKNKKQKEKEKEKEKRRWPLLLDTVQYPY